MGFLFPDPPKPPVYMTPPAEVQPVPSELMPLYQADQIIHGLADGQAEVNRRRQETGGDGPPKPPPGIIGR